MRIATDTIDQWGRDVIMHNEPYDGVDDDWVGGITADEIRAMWGGRLQPVPAKHIAAAAPVRRLPIEVGLPTAETYGITFAHDARLANTVTRRWPGVPGADRGRRERVVRRRRGLG
jgi:hypothetical protein